MITERAFVIAVPIIKHITASSTAFTPAIANRSVKTFSAPLLSAIFLIGSEL